MMKMEIPKKEKSKKPAKKGATKTSDKKSTSETESEATAETDMDDEEQTNTTQAKHHAFLKNALIRSVSTDEGAHGPVKAEVKKELVNDDKDSNAATGITLH